MRGKDFFGLAILLTLALGITGYTARGYYPTKPITLMVAYPAGGETDIGGRVVASIAEKDLGQPIIVVNKGGAGGQIGWTEMARQRGDGYYIGFINPPGLTASSWTRSGRPPSGLTILFPSSIKWSTPFAST